MKRFLPSLLFLFFSFSTLAQTEKVSIFCRLMDDGEADYGHLPGCLKTLMPDSVIAQMLVYPRYQYHIRNQMDAIDLLSLSGWKLVAVNTIPQTQQKNLYGD